MKRVTTYQLARVHPLTPLPTGGQDDPFGVFVDGQLRFVMPTRKEAVEAREKIWQVSTCEYVDIVRVKERRVEDRRQTSSKDTSGLGCLDGDDDSFSSEA